mgnify:CR=1 FL=1
MVIYHMDRFVWILGAVWTVGSYMGFTSLVRVGQIQKGEEVFRACLNHPGAGPNHDAILDANKFGEE